MSTANGAPSPAPAPSSVASALPPPPSPATRVATAMQIWQQAKAKSRGYSKQARAQAAVAAGITLEDADLDPESVRAPSAPAPTPRRSLDPLRNQRAEQQQQQQASPRKLTATEAQGFFKRFQAPKVGVGGVAPAGKASGALAPVVSSSRKLLDEDEGESIAVANGDALARGAPGRGRKPGVKAAGTPKDALSAARTTPQSAGARGQKKKTLAEEMREVARAAQKTLDGEVEDELPRTPGKQLDRRKSEKSADAMEIDESDADGMEVDVEDEYLAYGAYTNGVRSMTAALSAAAPPVKRVWQNVTLDAARVDVLRGVAYAKVTRERPMQLVGLEEEYRKVSALIKQTVTAGESNSMLLIGARGSGKTALLNRAIREHSSKYGDDFHVVRLNGFLHTDDKIALREIWRQLGREMEIDEGEDTIKNYADTLTTLLALLSHTGESGQVTKSVVFIMDEFELFATHPRQTLLYNLFDIAQSSKAPIAVLGLTTRIDVAESLEKRVKSRFSHRYVHLGLAKNFPAFEQICRAGLSISIEEDLTAEEKKILGLDSESPASLFPSTDKQDQVAPTIVDEWNSLVERILASDEITRLLRRIYYHSKSVPDFLCATIFPLATLPLTSASTTVVETDALAAHFITSMQTNTFQAPDSKLALLPSLSGLQLALLICAARLHAIYNTDVVSFVLAYEEYKTLASKAKLQASAAGALAQGAGARVWGKEVAKDAWEALLECGLVMEDGRAVAAGGSGRVDVGLEEIGASGTDLGMWARWCKEI